MPKFFATYLQKDPWIIMTTKEALKSLSLSEVVVALPEDGCAIIAPKIAVDLGSYGRVYFQSSARSRRFVAPPEVFFARSGELIPLCQDCPHYLSCIAADFATLERRWYQDCPPNISLGIPVVDFSNLTFVPQNLAARSLNQDDVEDAREAQAKKRRSTREWNEYKKTTCAKCVFGCRRKPEGQKDCSRSRTIVTQIGNIQKEIIYGGTLRSSLKYCKSCWDATAREKAFMECVLGHPVGILVQLQFLYKNMFALQDDPIYIPIPFDIVKRVFRSRAIPENTYIDAEHLYSSCVPHYRIYYNYASIWKYLKGCNGTLLYGVPLQIQRGRRSDAVIRKLAAHRAHTILRNRISFVQSCPHVSRNTLEEILRDLSNVSGGRNAYQAVISKWKRCRATDPCGNHL